MKLYQAALAFLCSAALSPLCFSNTDPCTSVAAMGDSLSSSWEAACESDSRSGYYDPYAPPVTYLAKYFEFQIEEAMDVQITLSDSSASSNFYLLNGQRGGEVLASSTQTLTKFLTAGTYTVEVTNDYTSNFYLNLQQVNQGTGECTFDISDNQTSSGSFSTDCLSENRADDYVDPYAPVNPSFRAKYYRFNLPVNADVRFKTSGQVNTYLYLLAGGDREGAVIDSFSNGEMLTELAAGTYTVEVTTASPGAFGSFNATLEILGDQSLCSKAVALGDVVSDEFSPNCILDPNYDEAPDYSDPYAPSQDAVRGNYYTLALSELAEARLNISSGDLSPLLNVFTNTGELMFSNRPTYYWSSPANELNITLPQGEYVVETSAYDQLAIGAYTLRLTALAAKDCTNAIIVGESQQGLLTERCLSQFRGVEGNNDPYSGMQDPYAPAPGDYYAKGFKFELSEAQSVRFSATQNAYSTFLYLAEKDEQQNYSLNSVLNQTQSQWGERYEELERHLAPGRYFAEVTTTSPERNANFTASLVELPGTACESYVVIEESTELEIGANNECSSQQKPTQSYYDPYASPPYFEEVFYASYNTFKVTEAGEYQLTMSNSNVVVDFFLLQGANKYSPLLASSLGAESIDVTLQPGYYTVETTTEFANEIGNVTLLVERLDNNQCLLGSQRRQGF